MLRWLHSAIFQSIIIATLIIVCVLFATRPKYGQHNQSENYYGQPYAENKTNEQLFGISPEGWTAIFTAVLAVFTIVLAISTILLWGAGERQLILSQRPRLRVRNVVIRDPNFPPYELISGQFYVSNIGGSPAKITESHCIVFISNSGLPMERPYEGCDGNMPIGAIKLEPGQSVPGFFISDRFPGPAAGSLGSHKVVGAYSLYIMGWIEYLDDIGLKRRTAFCRKYRLPEGEAFHSSRFYPISDHDYEHEE